MSRLQKIEEFYQNRTRILEERIVYLENENERLEKCGADQQRDLCDLGEELKECQNKFMRDLQKALKE